MKVYEGPALIAERARASLLPVRIEGVEYAPFSRLMGKMPRRWFPQIRLRILPGRQLRSPEGITGRARRVALRRQLVDEMIDASFATAPIDTTLFDTLLEATRQHGRGHVIADDITQAPITYGGSSAAAWRSARGWRRAPRRASSSGCCCRRSKAAVVAFFALHAVRRVPAMLNFSTGPAAVMAACRAAQVTLVVTRGAAWRRPHSARWSRRWRRRRRSSTSRTSSRRWGRSRSSARC